MSLTRFDTIIRLRRHERDRCAVNLANAVHAVEKVELEIRVTEEEKLGLQELARSQRFGVVSLERLRSHNRYEVQLQARLNGLLQQKEPLVENRIRSRKQLDEAEIELKRFKKIEQLDRERVGNDQLRRDRKAMDELAMTRFWHQCYSQKETTT
ncbi:flagellar export protein FliJ [bacterium]|nr:flagellar export protein FliJ [bacterium]